MSEHLPEKFTWRQCERGDHRACPGVHRPCSSTCAWPPCACRCHERDTLDDLLGPAIKTPSNSDIADLLG